MKIYEWGPEKRREIGKKGREYVLNNFNTQLVTDKWEKSLTNTIEGWKKNKLNRKQWEVKTV